MRILTSPEEYLPFNIPPPKLFVFLAGGISNTTDWQQEFLNQLACGTGDSLTIFNPRRRVWDKDDKSICRAQIEWEFRYLEAADVVIFWFSPDTVCPITLYELGVCAARGQHIIVGCHHDYTRKFDVENQLQLLRPEVHVRTCLDGIELDIRRLHHRVILDAQP